MATGREVNKISRSLTEGQLAITAPTPTWTTDLAMEALTAEGQGVQEAAPCLHRKLVSVNFLWHICTNQCIYVI